MTHEVQYTSLELDYIRFFIVKFIKKSFALIILRSQLKTVVVNENVNPVVSMLESKLTKGGTRTTRTTTQVIPRSLARGRRR